MPIANAPTTNAPTKNAPTGNAPPTAKAKPGAEAAEASSGGRRKLVLLLAVALVATGIGGYLVLFSGSSTAAEPAKGAVLALDPIAVNLAGGGYLKIGIALQLTADAGEEKPDGSPALDLIISTFSQAKPADVTGARDALKESLEKKIVDAYTEDGTEIVMGVYFTEYVTQ